MAESKQPTLKELIDTDTGFKSKRNALVWVSLILLTVTFTGAVIEEANTFILKIKFEQAEALSVLLVLAVLFLGVRYYSYACKYHHELTKLWKSDLLSDNKVLSVDYHSDEPSGVLVDISPNNFTSDFRHMSHAECQTEWNYLYDSKWFLIKYFVFEKIDKQVGEVVGSYRINLLLQYPKVYFKVLLIEFWHRVKGQFKYPENLDVQAPYFIAVAAVLSLVYQDELSRILKWILS